MITFDLCAKPLFPAVSISDFQQDATINTSDMWCPLKVMLVESYKYLASQKFSMYLVEMK